MSKEKDYEVGFCKPPEETQFKPGKSGNPRGRPLGSRSLYTIIEEELDTYVIINENGSRKTISKKEAIAKQTVNKAIGGDIHCIKLLFQRCLPPKEEITRPVQFTLDITSSGILRSKNRELEDE